MIEDLIDLWQRTLAAGVFPESNCWSSFIEALARHRLYESAYHIVGSYLAECQTVLKSARADSTYRALPDVKFAVVFVKLIGDPSIGDAETYKLRPLIPSYLFPRLKKSDDFAEQTRKLTPLEFEEFLGAFQLFKQNFENVKTEVEIRQSATDKILDSVKKNPKRIIPADRNHKK
jgi:predicted nucleotidyltransferase